MFFVISDILVFIKTRDQQDFQALNNRITFLTDDFSVREENFINVPQGSFVVLDDFTFKFANNKMEKKDFLSVTNYYLRHHKITLFLIIHNLHNNNLFNEILLAPHIFLAYSALGFYAIRYIYFCFLNFKNISSVFLRFVFVQETSTPIRAQTSHHRFLSRNSVPKLSFSLHQLST